MAASILLPKMINDEAPTAGSAPISKRNAAIARCFKNGRPDGMAQDVVTGFLNSDNQARGRPVGLAIDKSGALLIADDVGNTVWRVTGASELSAAQAR